MKIRITIKAGTYKGQKTYLNKEKRARILRHIDKALSELDEFYPLDIARRVLK